MPICLGLKKIEIHALIDSGALVYFIDELFAKLHRIPLIQKTVVMHVEVIDGRPLSSGNVTHETIPLKTVSKDHINHIIYNVIHSPSSPINLGLSWLEKYNPQIDWLDRTITFLSKESLVLETSTKPKAPRYKKFKKPLFIGARAFIFYMSSKD